MGVATSKIIREELVHNAEQRRNNKVVKEMLAAKKHLRDEVKEIVKEAKAQNVEEEFKAFHVRREQQQKEYLEQQALVKLQQQEKDERDAIANRHWRIDFYGKQAVEMHAALAERNEVSLRQARHQAQLGRTFDEWENREASRTRMQVEIPPHPPPIGLPGSELSIFGVEYAESQRVELMQNKGHVEQHLHDDEEEEVFAEHHGPVPREEWYLEEVDQHDNHVFDSGPYPEYERVNDDRMVIESDLVRNQELYEAIRQNSSNLQDSLDKMLYMKEKLERDQRQVNEEILQIEKSQLGPPRRLAMAAEIPAMDAWKIQHAKLYKKLNELQYAIDLTEGRKKASDAQMIPLAKSIAVLQEKQKEALTTMGEINGDLGLLPMVIGKNISMVAGNDVTAKPREALLAITHKSRLVGIRHQSEIATKLHKEANAMEQEMWVTRMDESSKKADLERIISRISDISERLKRSNVDTYRQNIIDSLRGFLASGLKLNAVYSKLVGMLPWYKYHMPGLSSGVMRYIAKTAMGGISFELHDEGDNSEALASGVTLGEGRSGYCTGVIKLPKDCLWNIVITISRQGHGPDFDSLDGGDFVAVQIGNTVTSMSPIGTFFNRINPNTGTVLYDVKHVYRGKSFAYRFDFSSSSEDPKKHLAVSTGMYEEYELKDLEVISDPKILGRTRVLSAYVKMIRMDEQSGKSRETRLLEELIMAEASDVKFWDSEIISQTLQRYNKEFFLRILRAEILLYQEVCRAKKRREMEETVKLKALMTEAAVQKEANLEQSMKKYLMNKRATQRKKLDEGKDLVGKRLILWDDDNHRWRNVTVTECLVVWVENGLVARVTHMVQEYDDAHEMIAGPKEVNLAMFKFFESPMQILDPEAIARSRERKKWDDSIQQIAEQSQEQVATMRQNYDNFRKRQERLFKKSKRKILDAFECTVHAKADIAADSSVARRALKANFNQVMLDIKKGVVKVKETDKPKEVAKIVARRRFVETWIVDRRTEVHDQLDRKEAEMRDMLEDKFEEYDQARRAVLIAAKKEREELQAMIRKQLAQRKEVLLRRVKFPKEVFKQVVPQAYHCEHLKTKAWGDNYGMGVKCLNCGKELSELHKEESQILGYGSGTDPSLYEAVKRHRDNEMTFRFKSSEELAAVERERIRLEKERREMEMEESYFYDFQDLEVIYDFDRRHAVSIKAAGIFRQGLQWKEDELQMFELTKITREKERLEKDGLPESLLENFDALAEIEEPPPTFRAVEEKHRAQYNQLVYSIGRLHNFNKRIQEFKMVRFDLLTELDVYAHVLESLHKESYQFESQLSDLEKDLDRTSKLLSTFQSMQLLWQQASMIQNQARKDKMKAEMNTVGLWADVKECQDRTTILHDETRTLLRFKLITDSKLDYQQKSVKIRTLNLADLHRKHEDISWKAESLRYCQPGNLVYTPYGQCYVTAFRQKDDMLLVLLPFGRPPAKAYIHYKQVVDLERSKQQGERLLMEVEDAAMAKYISAERIQIKKELYLMRREEVGLREYYQFIDLGKDEDATIKANIDAAVNESFEITESKRYRKLQKPHVKQVLDRMIKDRKEHRKGYIGPPSGRPKVMSTWEIYQQRKFIEAELKQKFIYQVQMQHFISLTLALIVLYFSIPGCDEGEQRHDADPAEHSVKLDPVVLLRDADQHGDLRDDPGGGRRGAQ